MNFSVLKWILNFESADKTSLKLDHWQVDMLSESTLQKGYLSETTGVVILARCFLDFEL